mmetsp:Transcript_22631/g.53719  ORF Transcript_22631/g.53719 Transcript_22631/m.53719 type:complete len:212 (+) Transcript_22631:2963-3598(+)
MLLHHDGREDGRPLHARLLRCVLGGHDVCEGRVELHLLEARVLLERRLPQRRELALGLLLHEAADDGARVRALDGGDQLLVLALVLVRALLLARDELERQRRVLSVDQRLQVLDLLRAGQYGDGAVADDDAGVWELITEQPVLQRRRLGVQLVIVGGPRDHGERVSALEQAFLLATVVPGLVQLHDALPEDNRVHLDLSHSDYADSGRASG